MDCLGLTCQSDSLVSGGSCLESCSVADCMTTISSALGGIVGGDAFLDPGTGVSGSFIGQRISPDVYRVSAGFGFLLDPDTEAGVTVELSGFRFSGDPLVFDGLEAHSVLELVAAGLIAETDVLFRESLSQNNPVVFIDIDLNEVPEEEIVLFVSAVAVIPGANQPPVAVWHE